jgi:hypothetical protein
MYEHEYAILFAAGRLRGRLICRQFRCRDYAFSSGKSIRSFDIFAPARDWDFRSDQGNSRRISVRRAVEIRIGGEDPIHFGVTEATISARAARDARISLRTTCLCAYHQQER